MTTFYRNICIVIPTLILMWQLPLAAQNAENIAAREVARRQAGIAQGKTALEHGQAAMKKAVSNLRNSGWRREKQGKQTPSRAKF